MGTTIIEKTYERSVLAGHQVILSRCCIWKTGDNCSMWRQGSQEMALMPAERAKQPATRRWMEGGRKRAYKQL